MPSASSTLATRGLSVLRSVGAWVAISPEQTYVATTIHGLGPCKSTYCAADRRVLPASSRAKQRMGGGRLAALLAVALAASGVLSSCASNRPIVEMRGVADRDQYAHELADCQIYAGPVSPGAPAQTGTVFGVILGTALEADAGEHQVATDAAGFGAVEGAVAGGAAAARLQNHILGTT